jgi:4a-hydroxytetrahydrobiopterin dehydratase
MTKTHALLTEQEILNQLAQLPSWQRTGMTIEKNYRFTNFFETMAFVNALAWVAHQYNHHPNLHIGFNHCHVHYTTHDLAGLTLKDFSCAAHIDQLSI